MKNSIRQRTCRCCRKKKDKKELLRLIITENQILEMDPGQNRPGRGWYLCPEETCLLCLRALKSRQKTFGRNLEIGPKLNHLLMISPAGGIHGQN